MEKKTKNGETEIQGCCSVTWRLETNGSDLF